MPNFNSLRLVKTVFLVLGVIALFKGNLLAALILFAITYWLHGEAEGRRF